MDSADHLKAAWKTVFSEREYVALGVSSFLAFLILYLFTLPATFTGGRVGLVSLRLLTPLLALFSFLMAALAGLIVPFSVYGFRRGAETSAGAATGGFLGSLLPPLLCCSPFIPTAVAVLAAFTPIAVGGGGFLQGFIATYEIHILTGATLLLVYAAVKTGENVCVGCDIDV